MYFPWNCASPSRTSLQLKGAVLLVLILKAPVAFLAPSAYLYLRLMQQGWCFLERYRLATIIQTVLLFRLDYCSYAHRTPCKEYLEMSSSSDHSDQVIDWYWLSEPHLHLLKTFHWFPIFPKHNSKHWFWSKVLSDLERWLPQFFWMNVGIFPL